MEGKEHEAYKRVSTNSHYLGDKNVITIRNETNLNDFGLFCGKLTKFAMDYSVVMNSSIREISNILMGFSPEVISGVFGLGFPLGSRGEHKSGYIFIIKTEGFLSLIAV